MGVEKGTKQNLAHSKFSVNRTPQELEGGVCAVRAGEEAPGDDSIFQLSELHREMPYGMKPETATPTELVAFSSSSSSGRDRSLRSLNQSAAAEDGPTLKHHLEQVFIKPPLGKGE